MSLTNHICLVLLLALEGCGGAPHANSFSLALVQPQPPQSTWDSIASAALLMAVTHGLPDWHPRRRVIVETDSGLISPSSLPRLGSFEFVLLDSAQAQRTANEVGDLNILTVARVLVANDSAKVSAVSHWYGSSVQIAWACSKA